MKNPKKRSLPVLCSALCVAFLFSFFAVLPSFAKDPLIQKGKQLYQDYRCSYCHSLHGKGGTVGPGLDNVGLRRTQEWMAHHFKDPPKVSPGTKMARIRFRGADLEALVAYLKSLGGVVYSPEAPKLFQTHCADCHNLGGGNSKVRTDLSEEGKYRDMGFIRDYIQDPSRMNQEAKMKAFKDILDAAQIKDLAAYIYLRGR